MLRLPTATSADPCTVGGYEPPEDADSQSGHPYPVLAVFLRLMTAKGEEEVVCLDFGLTRGDGAPLNVAE